MTETTEPTTQRNIWLRGFFMLLMALAWHVTGTVLCFVALIQFVLALLNDAPNDRLAAFGRSLARYVQQVASFLTFAAEEIPFPFSDWPVGEQ